MEQHQQTLTEHHQPLAMTDNTRPKQERQHLVVVAFVKENQNISSVSRAESSTNKKNTTFFCNYNKCYSEEKCCY